MKTRNFIVVQTGSRKVESFTVKLKNKHRAVAMCEALTANSSTFKYSLK